MRRCPECRAILAEKTGPCPFCGGEPPDELLELAKAAGAPDPERFAEDLREDEARTAGAAQAASVPFGVASDPGGAVGEEFLRALRIARGAVGGPSGADGAVPGRAASAAAGGNPSVRSIGEPEIAEERVSRHDESIGFQRSPTIQAVIVLLVVLFFLGLVLWFWN